MRFFFFMCLSRLRIAVTRMSAIARAIARVCGVGGRSSVRGSRADVAPSRGTPRPRRELIEAMELGRRRRALRGMSSLGATGQRGRPATQVSRLTEEVRRELFAGELPTVLLEHELTVVLMSELHEVHERVRRVLRSWAVAATSSAASRAAWRSPSARM